MALFDLLKRNNNDITKDLPNNDLLYISYDKNVPPVHRGLFFTVSFDNEGNIKMDDSSRQIPDPSTIYVYLPISQGIAEPLTYYPHYIEMSPTQRYKYLSWLRNVTEPIDMGYVFIYYYGLERQLLTGDFDKAFDEIIKLRNAHNNKSFLKYSENALINSALMRGRVDRLVDLHEKTDINGYSNVMFLIAYNQHLSLGVEQLVLIFHKAFNLSRTPEKENKQLYKECIAEVLSKRYQGGFPLSSYDISKAKTVTESRFANYSFSPEIQNVELTDFYSCKDLMNDLESLFNDSYSLYKDRKKFIKAGKTPEEIEVISREKREKRYKKLLKEKLINQEEYDTLVKAFASTYSLVENI